MKTHTFFKACSRLLACAAANTAIWYANGQTIIYVDDSAQPGGNGQSWASAFAELQDGLASAASIVGGDVEIWVAGGVYRPDRGTNDRNATFTLTNRLTLRGGFVGTESSPLARPNEAPPTVLSGDLGEPGVGTDNALHVVSLRNAFWGATLDRVTIADGRADGAGFPNNSGGGVLSEGTLVARDCVFVNNYAASGGGLFARFGGATIERCVFQGNFGATDGGGVYLRDAGSVRDSIFSGNNANLGGGLFVCCGSITVSGCLFQSNFGNFGASIMNSGGGLIVRTSTFLANSASRGAGVYCGPGSWVVSCYFGGNTADRGAGVFAQGSATLVNNTFSRNFAITSGGGVFASVPITLSHCTFVSNTSLMFGGGLYQDLSNATISSSIFWANTDSSGKGQNGQLARSGAAAFNVRNTCVMGLTPGLGGVGNIANDPLFVDADGPDNTPGTADDRLWLSGASPCIDAGDTSGVPADVADLNNNGNTAEPTPLDLDGLPRIVDDVGVLPNGSGGAGVVDMGAYEYQPPARIPGDTNLDGVVNFQDVTRVLGTWGTDNAAVDVDASGLVDFGDVSVVLANWSMGLRR